MRKIKMINRLTLILALFLSIGFANAQTPADTLETDIFKVVYSEFHEQPLFLSYTVDCPTGTASRSGMNFYKVEGIHTSDNDDYKDNPYDKGHLAPAAAFNCDRDVLKMTFSYLNCALQHEGLNRGPWKELEGFERDLAKVFDQVSVEITVNFTEELHRVPGGAAIPDSFTKIIRFDGKAIAFVFPNEDVSGEDWSKFRVLNW
jgi:endonuclease G